MDDGESHLFLFFLPFWDSVEALVGLVSVVLVLIEITLFGLMGAFQAHFEASLKHLCFLALEFEVKKGFTKVFLGEGCVAGSIFKLPPDLFSDLKFHSIEV